MNVGEPGHSILRIGYEVAMENSIFKDIPSFCMVCLFVVPILDNNNNIYNANATINKVIVFYKRSTT